MANGLFFIGHTFSPLHAGVGQAMCKVDLPIEREKHTTFPCVFATGLKGALRKYSDRNKADLGMSAEDIKNIFGNENDVTGAGGALFTDFKILLFPVRSSKGAFKWVTCDFVLKRLKRDLKLLGIEYDLELPAAKLVENADYDPNTHILLEDYIFELQNEDAGGFMGFAEFPKKDIYKIDDVLFKHLVNNATQIIARNVLNENKTSDNLWYEETLPAETVLYSYVLPSFSNGKDLTLLKQLDGKVVQIGGNETVGYGLTKLYVKQ